MKVIGVAGYSGVGKTTLVERLIPALKQRGQRVSVIKHAHHKFDIDHPGKDSFRHREAGAFEVVVASDKRLALMREFEQPVQLGVHQLLAELDAGVDWVLVEGFKHSDLPKIEVLRAAGDEGGDKGGDEPERPARYGEDAFVVCIACDRAAALTRPTTLPVFDRDDVEGIVEWLLRHAPRFDYKVDPHG